MSEPTLKEKTAKGLYWTSIGGGLQQVIGTAIGVVFARILSQDDYGIIGMLSIFIAIGVIIQDGGFSTGLINRKEIKHDDYNAVFWFSFISGLIIYIILFFCAPLIAAFFREPALIKLSRVLFLFMLIGSLSIAPNSYLTKQMKYKELTISSLIGLIISTTTGLVLVLHGYAYWSLVIQSIVNTLISTVLRWNYCPWKPNFHFNFQPLKEMFPFSFKLLLTNFVRHINDNILSVFFGRLYTKQEVGIYAQGNKWATMGYAFINSIISTTAQSVLVAADDRKHQRRIFRKMLRFITFLSFPAMLGLALVTPELIEILITDKWMSSATIMQLTCIWGAFFPISTLYIQLLITNGKSNLYLWNTTALGLLQIITLFCVYSQGITVMVFSFLLINLLWLCVWHYWVQGLIGLRITDVLKDIMPYLLISGIALGVSYFISIYIDNIYLRCLQKIITAVLIYVALMWKLDSVVFKESVHYILKRKIE
ncbi:MAG: lipopolysaccharide biosynthesis protein [Candidatus Symbiothrix sp.]|jgi:O-antigen/teichoic acid export membrane protein|nr:lipopolysaccharide biosynthesis protein [Candidatus Symbiothrix sp.]